MGGSIATYATRPARKTSMRTSRIFQTSSENGRNSDQLTSAC
jgi:hypothetical protein